LGFFSGLALIRADEAIVVPIEFWSRLPRLAKAAERAGFALVDAPNVAVDSQSGELVVAEPLFAASTVVRGDRVGDDRPIVSPIVAPGRYRITTWAAPPEPTEPSPDWALWNTWRILKRAQLFGPDRETTMAAARAAAQSATVVSLDDMTVPSLLNLLAPAS
jgi:hypothetical protein